MIARSNLRPHGFRLTSSVSTVVEMMKGPLTRDRNLRKKMEKIYPMLNGSQEQS
jgi:hypothetical protein